MESKHGWRWRMREFLWKHHSLWVAAVRIPPKALLSCAAAGLAATLFDIDHERLIDMIAVGIPMLAAWDAAQTVAARCVFQIDSFWRWMLRTTPQQAGAPGQPSTLLPSRTPD